MEERSYIERRNQIRRARRAAPKKSGNYFVLKLNMALAIGIMVLCANMIDLDITNAFCSRIKYMLTHNADFSELKEAVSSAVIVFSNGEGISVLAKEHHPVTIDSELITQMNELADAYENTQKKTNP